MIDLAEQRVPPAWLVDGSADMAVEVAIGAFRQAERPMHVNAETRVPSAALRKWRDLWDDRGRHDVKQAAISLRKASARWLIACFAAGSISPKVSVLPSGRKIGS